MDIELRSGIDTEKRVGEDSLQCGSYLSNQSNNTNRDNHVNAPKIIKKKTGTYPPMFLDLRALLFSPQTPNSLFSLLTHFIPSLTLPSPTPTPTCLCFLGFLYPSHFNPSYLFLHLFLPSTSSSLHSFSFFSNPLLFFPSFLPDSSHLSTKQ